MKGTVLIVDDEENMVHLLRVIFESAGYKVLSALSGREALEVLSGRTPDVVLLDIMMPEMDGWEVFRRMREDPSLPDVPVVVITAKKDEIDRQMGTELLRVDGYVTKPFVRKELVRTVERIIEGSHQGAGPSDG